jgi:cytochrome c peroxidase
MRKKTLFLLAVITSIFIAVSCSKSEIGNYPAVESKFGANINLNQLANYANQSKPAYITKDNTGANPITNAKATLGRVLFYDKQLSIDNSIACASCHKQNFAFGDTAIASDGVAGGLTTRHSMRLVNSRFANETKFFWDERAASLEAQTTQPIQSHVEMGFSGQSGRPVIATLLTKLQGLDYYNELFKFVYGDVAVTETRLQECLAQFVRSIQSFDSKYDIGRAQVPADNAPFPNFTTLENQGKGIFLTPPVFDASGVRINGGLGCQGCHAAPEFDIDPNTGNNGVIGNLNAPGIDINVTRAPSLRDLVGLDGNPNTPMMHTANFATLQNVIGHYGNINLANGNTRLDVRLRPNGFGQQLNLTAAEVQSVVAFIKTLTGRAVYTDARWSDPFK